MELKLRKIGSYQRKEQLLIVPYGIETLLIIGDYYSPEAFNRTLWN